MALVPDQVRVLGLMAAHEAAVGDLYRAYAGVFPDHREFFEQIAAQEADHARLIAGFAEQVRARRARVAVGRFSPEVVMASLDNVHEQLKDVGRKRLSPADALAIGLDLEEGMLEKKCFEAAETDAPELRRLLEKLEADTTTHRESIREALAREREQAHGGTCK